ncbi:Glutathione S-transferase omega-1 [Mactra antiquata]
MKGGFLVNQCRRSGVRILSQFVNFSSERQYSTEMINSQVGEFAIGKGQDCPPRKPGVLRMYSMRFCPYAQRTRLVLAHKGIPVEIVNVNLKRKPEWLFEMNPIGLVPVLEWDNNCVVHESATCNDFLDEAFPDIKLNPTDPYKKARDRQLWESMNKLISSFYDVPGTRGEDKKVFDRFMRALGRYEKELVTRGDGPFFGGDKVCMVDFMLWPWFERIGVVNAIVPATKITSEKFPRLSKWVEHMYQLPAVKMTMFDTDSHARFLTSLRVENNPDYDYGLVPRAQM